MTSEALSLRARGELTGYPGRPEGASSPAAGRASWVPQDRCANAD